MSESELKASSMTVRARATLEMFRLYLEVIYNCVKSIPPTSVETEQDICALK